MADRTMFVAVPDHATCALPQVQEYVHHAVYAHCHMHGVLPGLPTTLYFPRWTRGFCCLIHVEIGRNARAGGGGVRISPTVSTVGCLVGNASSVCGENRLLQSRKGRQTYHRSTTVVVV